MIVSYSLMLGDIFENYCKYDNLATFGRFCYSLSIITTFPLECFVTREVHHYFEVFKYVYMYIYIKIFLHAFTLNVQCHGIVLKCFSHLNTEIVAVL